MIWSNGAERYMYFSNGSIRTFNYIFCGLRNVFSSGYSCNICPLEPVKLEIYRICCHYSIPLNIFLEWKLNHLPESFFFQNYYLLWSLRNVHRIWLLLGNVIQTPFGIVISRLYSFFLKSTTYNCLENSGWYEKIPRNTPALPTAMISEKNISYISQTLIAVFLKHFKKVLKLGA